MEKITSRKNPYITHIRALSRDADYRYTSGEFLCDGRKLLGEALSYGGEITSLLWNGKNGPDREYETQLPGSVVQYLAPEDLFRYASPMENSPGPLFTVRIPAENRSDAVSSAIVLESVQDPGNVGTVIRTAYAFGSGAVILTGECADLYSPKTVRSTMGAIFRQRVLRLKREELQPFLYEKKLKLYAAVLSERAISIEEVGLRGSAVAVGSEGRGLSAELIGMCDGEVIIPMNSGSESLNAAVAASVLMWEMRK